MRWLLPLALLAPGLARAGIAPECESESPPSDYDEQVQTDFLQNTPALALTYSPLHGPVAHEGGHGALGIDLAVVPPLSCSKRFVFDGTATADPNLTALVPKFHVAFAFPELPAHTVIYVSAAYVPPITAFHQRTVLASAELGVGGAWVASVPAFQLGVRFHGTGSRTIGDVLDMSDEGDPGVEDLYVQSSYGADALVGWAMSWATPYAALGFTAISTTFYLGDGNAVINNLHPYGSFTFSVGLDGLVAKHFRWGAEFHGAPGGYGLPDKEIESSKPPPAYGHLYTGRVRLAYEF